MDILIWDKINSDRNKSTTLDATEIFFCKKYLGYFKVFLQEGKLGD